MGPAITRRLIANLRPNPALLMLKPRLGLFFHMTLMGKEVVSVAALSNGAIVKAPLQHHDII